MSVRRLLKALEDRIPAKQPEPPGRSEARQWMKEHLDRIANARRGNLSEEEIAEVEAVKRRPEAPAGRDTRGRGSLMAKCPSIVRLGESCKGVVSPGATYCVAHDPARAAERRRHASKAGKSKPNRELAEIKARLRELAEYVMAGRVNRSSAAVAGQLYNTVIRAVGVELKVREQQELIERLEELEELLERDKGERRGYA